MINKTYTHLGKVLTCLAIVLGMLSTFVIMAGDEKGRVNLLYLVVLYIVFPLCSWLLLLLLSISKRPLTTLNLISHSHLWPSTWHESVLELKREGLLKAWLFSLSQRCLLSFSAACIASFMMALLFSDISFVWRSTLLAAEDIYPVLSALALPWAFVSSAQPVLEHLVNAQDSRLVFSTVSGADYGVWWKFLLIAQLCYGFIPRLILWLWANHYFRHAKPVTTVSEKADVKPPVNLAPEHSPRAKIEQAAQRLENYSLVTWTNIPEFIHKRVVSEFGQPNHVFNAGAQGSLEQEIAAERDDAIKLVLVAAWEPPMGELADFLAHGQGYILPLDWQDDQLNAVSSAHLDEWQRFSYPLEHWVLSTLEEHKA